MFDNHPNLFMLTLVFHVWVFNVLISHAISNFSRVGIDILDEIREQYGATKLRGYTNKTVSGQQLLHLLPQSSPNEPSGPGEVGGLCQARRRKSFLF